MDRPRRRRNRRRSGCFQTRRRWGSPFLPVLRQNSISMSIFPSSYSVSGCSNSTFQQQPSSDLFSYALWFRSYRLIGEARVVFFLIGLSFSIPDYRGFFNRFNVRVSMFQSRATTVLGSALILLRSSAFISIFLLFIMFLCSIIGLFSFLLFAGTGFAYPRPDEVSDLPMACSTVL